MTTNYIFCLSIFVLAKHCFSLETYLITTTGPFLLLERTAEVNYVILPKEI